MWHLSGYVAVVIFARIKVYCLLFIIIIIMTPIMYIYLVFVVLMLNISIVL